MVNGTGEAGQGTLEAGPRPSADSEAGGPCRDSDTDRRDLAGWQGIGRTRRRACLT